MSPSLHLFEGFGVEIEYMIVDAVRLDVLPVCDEVLRKVAGGYVSEVERGELDWSNELVVHVIELKTAEPAPSLRGLGAAFARDVRAIEELLESLGGRLMPSAMHPWMDPHAEMRLWQHECSPVYEAFDRIFSCRGHGWSNLQSAHVNLPFSGDEEFGRLHAAIRLVLPLVPALAASSPVADGVLTGLLDTRLATYRENARAIPSVSGRVIPERVWTRAEYESEILERIYRDIAPHDPEGILQYEWLNARGAIARFDRSAIEIRLIDVQECPAADLAVVALVVAAVRALVEERWCPFDVQRRFEVDPLETVLLAATRDAEAAVIESPDYLAAFGVSGGKLTAGELWRHIRGETLCGDASTGAGEAEEWTEPLDVILGHGTLARRLVHALGPAPSRGRIADVYSRLCDCLRQNAMFHA